MSEDLSSLLNCMEVATRTRSCTSQISGHTRQSQSYQTSRSSRRGLQKRNSFRCIRKRCWTSAACLAAVKGNSESSEGKRLGGDANVEENAKMQAEKSRADDVSILFRPILLRVGEVSVKKIKEICMIISWGRQSNVTSQKGCREGPAQEI